MSRINYLIIFTFILLAHFYCQRDFDNPVDPDVLLDDVKSLAAEQEGQWIRLTWPKQEQLTGGYELERKVGEQSFARLTVIENPIITTYLDTSISTDLAYAYRLRGYSDKNYTPYTPEVICQVHFPVPYGLNFQIITDTSIAISWQDSASFENAFQIERISSLDTVWQVVGQTEPDSTTFIDKGLLYNIDYTYRIRAVTSLNKSAYSKTLAAKIYMATPTLENINPLNDHQMRIEWQESITFESGFIIERSQNYTMNWREVGRVDENVTIFIDDSLKVQKTYSYRIKAFSDKNSSEYSNQLDGQTFFPAPANLSIASWTANTVDLTWDDLAFEEGYILKYVAKDQMDTILHTLDQNITSDQLTGLDTSLTYIIDVQGITVYNHSLPVTAEITFAQQATLQNSFLAHSDTVLSLAFSRDGQYLASGGADSDVKIWAADKWQHIQTIAGGGIQEGVRKLSFAALNTYLIVGYHYSYLKLFEIGSWNFYQDINPITYPLAAMTQGDATGKFAVAKYKFVYVWSSSSWSLEKSFTAGDQAVYSLAYDSKGDWLASSTAEGGIKIWEPLNWTVSQTLNEHSGNIRMLSASANGQWLASGGDDQNIIIWDTDTWNSIQTLSEHNSAVVLLAFAGDNKWLASVENGDHRVLIWSTEDWQRKQLLQMIPPAEITSMVFSPDTKFLLAGDTSGKIWIWQFSGSWVLFL